MRSVFALCATVRRIAKFIALLYIVVPNLSRRTRGLENAARGLRPRAAFSRLRSQFFTIRTDPKPVNNLFIFFLLG